MSALLQIGLINAAVATVLACAVALIGRKVRQPALMHALWIIVLVKLVTPPVFEVPVEVPFSLSRLSTFAESLTAGVADDRVASRVDRRAVAESASSALPEQTLLADRAGAGAKRPASGNSNVQAASAAAVPRVSIAARCWMALGWLLRHAVAVFCGAWLAGTVGWFLLQGYTAFKFSRRLALATPASEELQQQADELARSMGLAHRPPVMIVRDVISPMLWGVGRNTRLLFPVNLLARLDLAGRETLIAHELAHYRRGDHWVRAFELFVSGIYWWNPVLWWARREIEIAEEECCDAWVIEQFPASPRSYAEALLETIDFLSEAALVLPPAAVGAGHIPFLRRRLTAIMRGVAPKKMTLRAWLAVAVAALVTLPWHPGPTSGGLNGPGRAPASTAPSRLLDPTLPNFAATTSESMKIASDLDGFVESWTAEMVGLAPEPTPEVPMVDRPWATAKSADGRYSITRHGGGGVSLHDAVTGQEDIDLSNHQILTVAFSPDGSQFVTGGADQTVRLWDSSTGVVRQTFPLSGSVQAVAFIRDGKGIVSASRDGLVLWNIDPDDEWTTLPMRHVPATCLAVSHDGRRLAVGSGSWMSVDGRGHVVVWDLDTLQEYATFDCDMAVGAIGFKSDNNTLATGDFQGRITFWNLSERQLIGTTLPRYKDAVAAARFSHDTGALAHVGLEDIAPPPELELRRSLPRGLFLNESTGMVPSRNTPKFGVQVDRLGAGRFENSADRLSDHVVLEAAPATGLRDLQTRIEALEQSIDSEEGRAAIRQGTNSTGDVAQNQTPRRGAQPSAADVPADDALFPNHGKRATD
ncbi:MAG TPA: M56 family metallopeptidase [Planctomycetaceae bacterium]